MTSTLGEILSAVAHIGFWLIFIIIWSTIMGNSRPFLSAIFQQATLFSALIGLGHVFSPVFAPNLSEPIARLLGLGLVIISEIFVFKLVVPRPMAEDRVFFGVQLTIAIPLGFNSSFSRVGYST
jgi:hypothetical protein